jgi:hypothetical protein
MGYADLGAKVKSKYQGKYDDIPDDELGKRTLAKYPEYADMVGDEGGIEDARLHRLKSIFPKTEVERGGTSPMDVALSTIEGTGRDITAIPAAYFNQMGAGLPKAAVQSAGYKYPAPGIGESEESAGITSPVAGALSKVAGATGMLTSPVYRALVPATGIKAGYLPTMASGAAMGAVTGGENLKETLDPMEILKRSTMGAVTSGAFKGAGDVVGKVIPTGLKKGAESLLESTLAKAKKYNKFGAKPSRGILSEGISGNSPEEIQFKVQNRLEELTQAKEALLADPAHGNRKVDVSSIYDPIDAAIAEASRAPEVNAGLISKLQKARADVSGMLGGRDLTNFTLAEANALKQNVGKLSKFSGNAADKEYQTFDKAANSMYGNLNSKIHEVSPELAEINLREADLIPASNALERGDMLAGKTGKVAGLARHGGRYTMLGALWPLAHGNIPAAAHMLEGGAAGEALSHIAGNVGLRSKVASGMYKAGQGMESAGEAIGTKLQALLGAKQPPGAPPAAPIMASPRPNMGPYGAGPQAPPASTPVTWDKPISIEPYGAGPSNIHPGRMVPFEPPMAIPQSPPASLGAGPKAPSTSTPVTWDKPLPTDPYGAGLIDVHPGQIVPSAPPAAVPQGPPTSLGAGPYKGLAGVASVGAIGSMLSGTAEAAQPINIDKKRIEQMESSGGKDKRVSSAGAVGIRQITPIALKDYNEQNPESTLTMGDMRDDAKNRAVSDWIFGKRIPEELEAAGLPVTEENIVKAYNLGVTGLKDRLRQGKALPKETRDYSKKYKSK